MNFEKNSAAQLNKYASAVDMERLWGNIDEELRPIKRPFNGVIWSLSGLAILLMAVLFFVFGNGDKEHAVLPIDIKQAKTENPKPATTLLATESEKEAIPQSTNPIIEQTPEVALTPVFTSKVIESQSVVVEKEVKPSAKPEKNYILGAYAAEEDVLHSKEFLIDKNGVLAVKSTSSFIGTGLGQKEFDRLSLLPSKPINQLSIMMNRGFPEGFDRSPETGCYSFGKKNGWKPYIAIYGGAQKPLKTLKTDDADLGPLRDLRKETETVLEGVSGGALIGLLHPSGLHFEVGGEYNRINERFEYTVTEVDTIGRTLSTGFIINAPGDTTFFMDSVFVVQTNESLKKIYNKYSYIQIPITVGYEFNTNARLTPYVKGGIMVNVSFSQKAEIMTSPSTSVLYESNNSDNQSPYPFRTKIGISPHISVGMRYELNSWMHLFGEARYVHHLKESSASDYPITQKYKLPGINIGLRFFKPIRYD